MHDYAPSPTFLAALAADREEAERRGVERAIEAACPDCRAGVRCRRTARIRTLLAPESRNTLPPNPADRQCKRCPHEFDSISDEPCRTCVRTPFKAPESARKP